MVAMFADERDNVAAPNDASVTKRSDELGRRAVPKRTAVPAGDERVSVFETTLFSTGKTERKPVLFFVGSPFTVVMSIVESPLKNVWETVLSGPTGGVVWFNSNGRRQVSSGVRPSFADIAKQATPAFAPEFATHA